MRDSGYAGTYVRTNVGMYVLVQYITALVLY